MYRGRNLNVMSLELLTLAPEIGEELGQKIVEQRCEAPFSALEDLLERGLVDCDGLEALGAAGFHTGQVLEDPPGFEPAAYTVIGPPPGFGWAGGFGPWPGPIMRQQAGGDGAGGGEEAPKEEEEAAPKTNPKPRIPLTHYIDVPVISWGYGCGTAQVCGPGSGPSYIQKKLPGYCTIVWILTNGANGAVGDGGSEHGRGATPHPGKLGRKGLSIPTQAAVDTIAAEVREANTNVFQHCDFGLQVCAVHVVDTSKARSWDDTQSLGQAVFDDGVLYGKERSDPLQELKNALTTQFRNHFKSECVHLFYVDDVQKSRADPDNGRVERTGVGGAFTSGSKLLPITVIEGGAKSIAHEVLHGMDIEGHSEESDDPAVRDDPDNVLKEEDSGWSIQASQCKHLKAFVHKNLRRGCP